jgi:hypothetical protein
LNLFFAHHVQTVWNCLFWRLERNFWRCPIVFLFLLKKDSQVFEKKYKSSWGQTSASQRYLFGLDWPDNIFLLAWLYSSQNLSDLAWLKPSQLVPRSGLGFETFSSIFFILPKTHFFFEIEKFFVNFWKKLFLFSWRQLFSISVITL